MGTADGQFPDENELGIPDSARHLLMTFVFDLASQHVRKFKYLDPENLSHEIGVQAFEQMCRQPSARDKVCESLKAGNENWKSVAFMCVIHARADKVKREIRDRGRRSGIPVEELGSSKSRELEERVSELRHCVKLLANDRQTVLHLRFDCGLTFEEIAERMNWSKTRVHGCVAATLVRLERCLKEKAS